MSTKEPTDAQILAKLIKSTRTSKPYSDPFETGYLVNLYLARGHSIRDLAGCLELSAEMIREIKKIGRLPKAVKNLLRLSSRKNLKDIAYRISMLKNEEDQKKLAKLVVEKDLDTKTVRNIITFKKYNPGYDIEGVLKRVVESKDVRINRLLIPIDSENLRSILNSGKKSTVRNVLKYSYLELATEAGIEENTSFKFLEPFIRLDLSDEGYKRVSKLARRRRMKIPNLVNHYIKKALSEVGAWNKKR